MSDGDGVKRVKSREFTGISPLQLAGTGVKLVKTRVVFVGQFPLPYIKWIAFARKISNSGIYSQCMIKCVI